MGFGGKGFGPERTGGAVLPRSAPTIWNAAYSPWQFWDGRAKDLEEQAIGPITTDVEMGEDPDRLVEELKAIPEYVELFDDAFGGKGDEAVTFENVRKAIASFERTLLSFNSKFDRYAAGDFSAFSAQEKRGMMLFRSLKTRCFECHTIPAFTDGTFRVIGVPAEGEHDRGGIDGEALEGGFKTPTLRNIALTAPYMHNGAFETLEEVIEFYGDGGGRGEPEPIEGIDDKIGTFDISEAETADLVTFLEALTDTSLLPEAPTRVPSGLPVLPVKSKPMEVPEPTVVAQRAAAPAVVSGPMPRLQTGTGSRFGPRGWSPRAQRPRVGTRPARTRGAAMRAGVGRAGPRPTMQGPVTATFTVNPGQSIQAAIDRARPGDRIEVRPGVYNQTLTVDRNGVTLIGLTINGERAILDGQDTLSDAIQASGSDFTVEGFTIRNYTDNGIVVNQATNVVFRNLVVENPGLYAVYPVECTGVLVEGCVVSGAKDAGIYVGQSRDIVVRNNEVFHNVAGIEIENSVNASVYNNSAHHNTAGILVFVLPNNPSKVGSDCRVINNRVHENNLENFAKPGSTVSYLPRGIGILVMAADRTEIARNRIIGNDSYGVVVLSLTSSSNFSKRRTLDVEPHSDFTLVHANIYRDNGKDAAPRYKDELGAPGGDLFWDRTGVGNAWDESMDLTTFPPDLLQTAGAINSGTSRSGGVK